MVLADDEFVEKPMGQGLRERGEWGGRRRRKRKGKKAIEGGEKDVMCQVGGRKRREGRKIKTKAQR